jgi:hypothetical protein
VHQKNPLVEFGVFILFHKLCLMFYSKMKFSQFRLLYRGFKNAALKLLYGVQKHLVGEGIIFFKFLVFISLHN